MALKRPDPEPFHPPVGTSDEAFPLSRRWLGLGLLLAAVLLAALAVAFRP